MMHNRHRHGGAELLRYVTIAMAVVAAAACSSPAGPACGGLDFSGRATIHGILIDKHAPVAAALVGIGSSSAITSTDGSFAIANAAAGPQAITVAPDRAGRIAGEVSVLAGQNVLRIPVARAGDGILAGRTLDGCTGRPISGVVLTIGSRSATSDADGLYQIDGLCCGTLPALQATAEGHQPYSTDVGRIYASSRWLDVVFAPRAR
jgi:hypothetical protein